MQAPKKARGYSLDLPRQGQGTPNGASPNRPIGTEETTIWLLDPFERPDDVRLEEDQHYQIRWFDKKGQKLTGCATAWLHCFNGIPDAPVREDELIDRLLDNHRALKKECKKLRERDKKSRTKSTKEKSRWKERIQELKDELKKQGEQFHWKELVFGAGAILAWEHIPRERLLALLTENAPAIWAQIRAIRDSDKAKQENPMAAERSDEATQESSMPGASMEPPEPVPSPAAQNVPAPQNSPLSSDSTAAKQAPNQTAPPRSPWTAILQLAQTEDGALAGALAMADCLLGEPITEADFKDLRNASASHLRQLFRRKLVSFHGRGWSQWGPPADTADRLWRDVIRPFRSACAIAIDFLMASQKWPEPAFSKEAVDRLHELLGLRESYDAVWPDADSADARIGIARRMHQDLQRWQKVFGSLDEKTSQAKLISTCTREATEMLREALAKLESLPQPAKKLEAPSRAILEASLDLVVKVPAGALAGAVAVARWIGGLPMNEAELHALRTTPAPRLRKELQGLIDPLICQTTPKS